MAAPTAPGRIDRAATGLRRIVAGSAGARLPGERDLAARLGVPRPRLRALLAELEREGLVVRRHGSGTYAVDGFAGEPADTCPGLATGSPLTARSKRSGAPGAARRGSAAARRAPHRALRVVTVLIDAEFKLGRDPFCATVIEHLEAACDAAGARLALTRTTGGDRPRAIGDGAIALGEAGVRLVAGWRDDDVPLVALFADAAPRRRASVVRLDESAAGAAAASELIGRGCRTLRFVGRRDLAGVRDRLAGATAVARSAGVAINHHAAALTHAGGLASAAELTIDRTTGVIAANDWLAIGLRAGLAARGAVASRVPLVAFDGLALAADPALAIASLQPPFATIAADALAELARLRLVPGRALRYACAWRS